jgi:glutathione S-transferase
MACHLHIGNRNDSSWSLRPWIAMRQAAIPFAEVLVSLEEDAGKAAHLARLPAGRVPALEHDGLLVWDSLAICGYLAERHPGLWPADPAARALARSAACEMHAGFTALRNELPMDVRSRRPQRRRSPAVLGEIARLERPWAERRGRSWRCRPCSSGRPRGAATRGWPIATSISPTPRMDRRRPSCVCANTYTNR